MKNIKEMTFDEMSARRRELQNGLEELYSVAANRELKEDETQSRINMTRELELLNEAMKTANRESEHSNVAAEHRQEKVGEQFREILKNQRFNPSKAEREITLLPTSDSATNNITASGAINLTVKDLIPTLHEGLDLPKGLGIVTGVEGNEVWPVSVNDVEMEEVGEIDALSDQVMNFANITPSVNRCGLTVPVSNMAIDNAAFDLMSFVQKKFSLAYKLYWAKKIYSRIEWSKNKGPFSGMNPSGIITIGDDTYRQILVKVAEFSDKGFFDGDVCISMDRTTEAKLKSTPKIAGAAGGFVIENGLCAGYPYTVSHFTGSELNADGTLIAGKGHYLMIGYYEWFAGQQHGDVRMTIDATSQQVAKKNITAVTLNTAFSMTDLSQYINGANGVTQAFACYAVMDEGDSQVLASQHVVSVAKSGTKTVTAVTNISGATVSYAVTTALSGLSVGSSTGVITAGTTAGTAVITVTATDGTTTKTDTITVIVS